MFKKVLIGVAAVAGLAAVGYAGLITYAMHEITKGLNKPWDEVA
jgi:hypothetical protein